MKKLLLFAVVFVAARPVYAEVNFGYTAEWLSHESAVIALATPVKVENTKGPGDVWFIKTQFQLLDVIKGPQSNGDTITIYDFSYKPSDALSLDKAKKESKQLLVFARVAEHMFKQINGKYVFTQVQQFKSAYYTDQPVAKLYTPDFGLLTTFDDLLKRTKEQVTHEATLLRQYWKGTIVKKSLDVPGDSEAYRDLWAGSTCFLWVPEYKKEQTSNKTDEIPNQSSDVTAKPVSIKSATPNDFKSMLLLASGDGSSRYFIGFSEDWAYCEAKDGNGNVTIYFARKADLDEKLRADLVNELRKRYEAGKSKDGSPVLQP